MKYLQMFGQPSVGTKTFRGEGAIEYLIFDKIIAALAAGSVHDSLAEPGRGVRKVTDTGSNLSITGEKAVSDGIVGAGDPALSYVDKSGSPFPRTGLMMQWDYHWVASRGGGGFGTTLGGLVFGFTDAGGILTTTQTSSSNYPIGATATDYVLSTVLFLSGGAMWVDGTLMWVDDQYSADPIYPVPLFSRAVASQMKLDNVAVWTRDDINSAEKLAGIHNNVYDVSPVNGINFADVADSLNYLDISALGSPSALDRIAVHFRQSDIDNYWSAFLEWSGTQWDFKVIRTVAGVDQTADVDVAAVGTPDSIAVITDGDDVWALTGVNGLFTLRGTKTTNSFNNTATEVGAWYDIGTMSLLRTFKRNGWAV